MRYPVTLDIDRDGVLVGCPDIPKMHSVGDTEDEALLEAEDGLESAIEIYFDQHVPVPLPSRPTRGQRTVEVSALTSAKILLHNEMLAQGVKKADLARALCIAPSNVERFFRVRHKTRIETLEAALRFLGKHLDIRLA
jgi:antitoxin HicB